MTAEELYSIINAEIEEKAKHDIRISLLKRRIENGSASIAEAVEYNQLVNEIMAKSLSGKVLGTDQREELCKMLLKDSYDKSNEALSTAQRGVDAKTGLNIQPKKASFPAERVDTVAKSLTDTTVEDSVIQRRAENAVENVANSFSVDYIKENAKFRTDAGIKCYIERTTDGKCCEWCTRIAGRYEYATAPVDVFRRHDNCSCICTYINGKIRQDVWSKKILSEPSKIEYKKPRVISKDEAKKLESENINYKGLKSEKSVDKPYIDVSQEYLKNATPGIGNITFDSDYQEKNHKEEIDFAKWIHQKYGGDIHIQQEHHDKEYPDYIWRGKFWELKSPKSQNGTNSALRKGYGQISTNPGGVIIDYGDNDVDFDFIMKAIEKRMQWYDGETIDIMIVNRKETYKILRYKKR